MADGAKTTEEIVEEAKKANPVRRTVDEWIAAVIRRYGRERGFCDPCVEILVQIQAENRALIREAKEAARGQG